MLVNFIGKFLESPVQCQTLSPGLSSLASVLDTSLLALLLLPFLEKTDILINNL